MCILFTLTNPSEQFALLFFFLSYKGIPDDVRDHRYSFDGKPYINVWLFITEALTNINRILVTMNGYFIIYPELCSKSLACYYLSTMPVNRDLSE